ncbi:hypothetical protein Xbed_00959 [Xenorhabdus beddingii]|uniref:Uncharacterized protein n=1 Tax=Xenorhabdus beddingii TaxID=40578 RepID=A0A1Y2SPH7_9GAMM|nr:hypothetical protein Xbed_00959 [Xenorhabdus beddingii]
MNNFDKNIVFVFGINLVRSEYFKQLKLSYLNAVSKDKNIDITLGSLNNTLYPQIHSQ